MAKKDYPNGPICEMIELTPDLARKFLQSQLADSLRLGARAVDLERAIRKGDFYVTGQGLTFDWDDQMIDGQTRCRAVILANKPVTIFMVRGCDPKAQSVIDTGRARTLAHAFQINGVPNSAIASTVTTNLWWYLAKSERGVRGGHLRTGDQKIMAKPDHPERIKLYYKHDAAIQEACRWGARPLDVRRTVAATCRLIFSDTAWMDDPLDDDSSGDLDEFFDQWISGEGLTASDPVYVLRKTLAADARRSRESKHFGAIGQWAIITKAWNAFRKGDEMQVLRYRAGGSAPEPFPRPI